VLKPHHYLVTCGAFCFGSSIKLSTATAVKHEYDLSDSEAFPQNAKNSTDPNNQATRLGS